jgi:hypothetical protein
MGKPTYVCDYELSAAFDNRSDLHRFGAARVLLRLHGRPLGQLQVPIVDGRVDLKSLRRRIVRDNTARFATLAAERAIDAQALPSTLDLDELLRQPPNGPASTPTVTVAVCTRDKPGDLERCLAALLAVNYPGLDILVSDNASSSDATAALVGRRFPHGAPCARAASRSTGAQSRDSRRRGEILASPTTTSSSTAVDSGLARTFAADLA